MKVMISRVSDRYWGGDFPERPVPDAVIENIARVDIRTAPTVEELNCRVVRENWFKLGTNHRTIENCIARDFVEPHWVVEVESVEAFVREHGKCRIWPNYNGMIEIRIIDEEEH